MGVTERKEKEKQKRRNSIIKAAEKIFFSENGDKGTMENVAAKVQLGKGTLYLYFKNKTYLLYAIAEKGVSILTSYLEKVIKPEHNGRQQLSDLGDEFVHFVEDYPKHFELILRFELTDSHAQKNEIPGYLMDPALNILRETIARGQNDGSIRNDLSQNEIVIILWSQMLGLLQNVLRQERYVNRYHVELKKVIQGHYRIIMKGIASEETTGII
jgi:AcrR family transcriptional regulator